MTHGKKTWMAIVLLFVMPVVAFFALGAMRDPPVDYTPQSPDILRQRIAAHKTEIANVGSLASCLDADRYWPYDRDRAALGLLLFMDRNKRWAANWQELRVSGLIEDTTCIHDNWELASTPAGWEIRAPGWGAIAYYAAKYQAKGPQ